VSRSPHELAASALLACIYRHAEHCQLLYIGLSGRQEQVELQAAVVVWLTGGSGMRQVSLGATMVVTSVASAMLPLTAVPNSFMWQSISGMQLLSLGGRLDMMVLVC